MTTDRYPCLKINCPELFADPEFQSWLSCRSGSRPEGVGFWTPVATWHRPEDGDAGEFADVFCTYERGPGEAEAEGSDSDMPEHCWSALCRAVENEGLSGFVLLWLTNLAT